MFRVKVYGAKQTARAFTAMGLRVRDLAPAWDAIGAKVKRDAIPLTPVKSGALVESLRQGKTKTQATVRAGSKAVPYAGVLHYGGIAKGYYGPHHVGPVPFLVTSLLANRDYADEQVETEVMRIARRCGLK